MWCLGDRTLQDSLVGRNKLFFYKQLKTMNKLVNSLIDPIPHIYYLTKTSFIGASQTL